MSSYIQGISEYIPQFQPFQPDYNFLGNILQTKQSQYDANQGKLNKLYGTLLNSPMLRQDNLEQRDEFFKMIDNDIKRISGTDLSLQQNADAANNVFESFYNNKEMVKDMTYTKEYQHQLQIAENYRNCIDQEKCGGKYWDIGKNALNYQADEFKKASRSATLGMNPGRFTPMINVEEKATKYLTELLGKSGEFGVSTVKQSADGRYNVTLKNGKLLQIPFEQLLLTQYGKDQSIQDMYKTEAYVNRKSFVAGNLDKFGGDEAAAENEYFTNLDTQIKHTRLEALKAQDLKNGTNIVKTILEEKIKKDGSTGQDDIAFDYETALADDAAADESNKYHTESLKLAESIFETNDDINIKRQRADQIYARSKMSLDLKNAANIATSLTGSVEWKEDPYAKSYYDFSLDMVKQDALYKHMAENEKLKTALEMAKGLALMTVKKMGTPKSNKGVNVTDDEGVYVKDVLGTSTGKEEVYNNLIDTKNQYYTQSENNAENYVTGYANILQSDLKNTQLNTTQRTAANVALEKTFNKAVYYKSPVDGKQKIAVPGWDAKKNAFVNMKNQEFTSAKDYVAQVENWNGLYANALATNKAFKHAGTQGSYLEGEGKNYITAHDNDIKLYNTSSKVYMDNNKAVRESVEAQKLLDGTVKISGVELKKQDYWNDYFTSNNNIKSKNQFIQDIIKKEKINVIQNPATNVIGFLGNGYVIGGDGTFEKLGELYDEYSKIHSSAYNTTPGVKSLYGSKDFQDKTGGKYAGATLYNLNTDEVASKPYQGTIGFSIDVAASNEALFSVGNVKDKESLRGTEVAEAAYKAFIGDLESGNLTEKEALVAKTMYLGVGLSNEKFIGNHIVIPPTYFTRKAKEFKDADAELPAWLKSDPVKSDGITAYIPRENATNKFTQDREWGPYDWLLNHEDQTLSNQNAGEINISKRNSDGTFSVQGYLYGYEGKNRITQPLDLTIYPDGTSGQNLWTGLNALLDEAGNTNKLYVDNGFSTKGIEKSYNPQNLKNIQKRLNQLAGDNPQQTPNDVFRNAFLSAQESLKDL